MGNNEDPATTSKNATDYEHPMFSILNDITNYKNNEDKYHLKYVSITHSNKVYKTNTRMKQSHNPVETINTNNLVNGFVPGYQAIDVNWTNNNAWGGLSKQSTNGWIHGSPGSQNGNETWAVIAAQSTFGSGYRGLRDSDSGTYDHESRNIELWAFVEAGPPPPEPEPELIPEPELEPEPEPELAPEPLIQCLNQETTNSVSMANPYLFNNVPYENFD